MSLPSHPAGGTRPAARPRVAVLGANVFEDGMESHVIEALEQLGCETRFVSTRPAFSALGRRVERVTSRAAQFLLPQPERLIERRVVAQTTEFEPQLVLVILGNELAPATVARLRRAVRCPIMCWFQDALTSLGRQYVLGAGYDILFFKDRYLVDLFGRMLPATSVRYLPESCNPRLHRPVDVDASTRRSFGCDVMIAGSLYYYRQQILEALADFDLKVWGGSYLWLENRLGARWQGRALYGGDKGLAVCAAHIALNTLHPAEIDGLNCRAFELAGFGAFQLVSYKTVVAEHFEPGVEIETFSSIDELRGKIRHFLAHPAEARAIGERAHQRAMREHTYAHRMRTILSAAGIAA